jgi:aminoglycoside phosphotransferase (APT) family kinase protein
MREQLVEGPQRPEFGHDVATTVTSVTVRERFGMALLTHRDPLVVGTALARWKADRTGVRDVRVVNAEHPSIGYSSETVLVDLAWSGDGDEGGEQTHEFVVRLAPPTVGTFRDYDLAQQTTAQMAAAAAGVAVATPELVSDPQWLGTQFVVMPRVRGHLIGEVAVFDPWLVSLAEGQRAQVHEALVAAVVATHRADRAAAAGVPARDNEAELDFWADYLDWSSSGAPVPALVEALEWCRAHRPAVESEPVLLWGDVRFGNVIFGDDLTPLAVLDWDMTSIGAPEHDVAWFTTIESTTRSILGQHLEGFPDRDGTITQYESLSGRRLVDVEWYEILASIRSTAILARIGYLHQAAGLPSPLPLEDNPLLDLLAARIASAGYLR